MNKTPFVDVCDVGDYLVYVKNTHRLLPPSPYPPLKLNSRIQLWKLLACVVVVMVVVVGSGCSCACCILHVAFCTSDLAFRISHSLATLTSLHLNKSNIASHTAPCIITMPACLPSFLPFFLFAEELCFSFFSFFFLRRFSSYRGHDIYLF